MISKKPTKPTKPTKKVEVTQSASFYFDHVSKKVSIDHFNEWVKQSAPTGATDITLSLEENYDYESGEIMNCFLIIQWNQKIDNNRYVSEMKKYDKQLAKWKKQWQK